MRPGWLQRKIWKARRDKIVKRGPVLIRTSVLNEFLNRKRRDFSQYKTKGFAWLQQRMEELPVRPPIWKALRKEQRIGFIAGVECRKFCFWYDMGMGKTIMAIALGRYFKRAGEVKRVLVLLPNKVNKYEWAREIQKHSPKSTFTVLAGSTENKWKQLMTSDSLFVLETYGGLVRLLCSMVETKKGKAHLTPSKAAVRALVKLVQGIVMDESIKIAHKKGRHGSLMHRLCKHIAKKSKVAFVLNGTPFGRDPSDMWGQFNIIDQGETLGATLGLFRAAFFTATQTEYGGFDYTFDKSKEALLNKLITNRSIRYEADASTLPAVVKIVKPVSLPQGAAEYYKQAKDQIIAAGGNYSEVKNVFLRMRQISSGFIGYSNDETGTKCKFEFATNPKLETLMGLIDAMDPGDKMVVFHQFTYSGDMIERELKKAKVPFARLSGKTKNPDEPLSHFHDDKRCAVFLLQNDSGGFGLDRLKVARYAAYFESPVDTVLRVQTGRRVQRQGSEHKRVFIYDLVVSDTVDEQILEAHEQGIDLFKAIVDRNKRKPRQTGRGYDDGSNSEGVEY